MKFKLGGAIGFFYGIFLNSKEHYGKGKSLRLLLTSSLNSIGKQSSRLANGGASLCLIYCFTRRIMNFLFEDEMKSRSASEKIFTYGFFTGMIFKSTRGILPALLFGTMSGTLFWAIYQANIKFNLKLNCI